MMNRLVDYENTENNSNRELLCIYRHDNEHRKIHETVRHPQHSWPGPVFEPATNVQDAVSK